MLSRKTINIAFGILGILMITAVVLKLLPFWLLIFLTTIWLGITTYGVVTMKADYFLKSYSSNPHIKQKVVAITFDDGPDQNTLKVLAVLRKYNVKATFFCIGKQIETYPEIAKQIIADGHIIANHTYTHAKWIDIYGTKRFIQEIKNADAAIQAIVGKTSLFFRPPYGITNPNIARAIKMTKHYVIGWNKRSFDTIIPSERTILNRITKNLIILVKVQKKRRPLLIRSYN